MKKVISLLTLLLFGFIGIASAGLEIVGDNAFVINKTIGQNETFIFQLRNSETFPMLNVSFENNNYLYMPQTNFGAGEIKNITAVIYGNNAFSGIIRVKGLYESNLGTSNNTYNIDVNYDNGTSLCDLVAVVGDTVVWNNSVADTIKMMNADTNNEVASIPEGSFYTMHLDSPISLRYYFLRRGFQFTTVCTLTGLSGSGMINNPSYDAQLNMNISVAFDPTQMSATFLETNYNVTFDGKAEGVFTIKNIGTKLAKSIKIQGNDWFTFSPNNFDLAVGQTKGILYSIDPLVLTTNDTNKSYPINVTITGNFASITQTFNVFIPFANIASGNLTGNSLSDLLLQFCAENPEVCNPSPQIVYRNPGEAEVNVSVTQNQVKEIFGMFFDQSDKMELFQNFVKEKLDLMGENNNLTTQEVQNIKNDINSLKVNQDSSKSLIYLFIFIILLVIGASFAAYIYIDHKRKVALGPLRRQ